MAIATITTPPLNNIPSTGGKTGNSGKIILWVVGIATVLYLGYKYVYPVLVNKFKKDDSKE